MSFNLFICILFVEISSKKCEEEHKLTPIKVKIEKQKNKKSKSQLFNNRKATKSIF